MFIEFSKMTLPSRKLQQVYENSKKKLEQKRINYLKNLGFTDLDIKIIDKIEEYETSKLHRHQSYLSRYSMLRSGTITVEQVKQDIQKWLYKPYLFIISGVSGSGKTSTMREVMSNEVVSLTSRKPRANEIDGLDYYFTTKERIIELKELGELIEYNEYKGNHYGIARHELKNKLSNGHAFVIAEFNGYKQLKKEYEKVVGIFINVSKEDAYNRMIKRGDSEESIQSRMAAIEKEQEHEKYYDFVVVNEDGKQHETVRKIKNFIDEITKKGVLYND